MWADLGFRKLLLQKAVGQEEGGQGIHQLLLLILCHITPASHTIRHRSNIQ